MTPSPSVLILGALSDLGRALAHEYAKQGARLLLAARRPERLAADVGDLGIRYQVKAEAVAFDALDFESHASFYEALDPKPDVVICVFGYLGEQTEAEQDWEQARQIMDTNYTGAASILHHAAQHMSEQQRGTIVGISSVAGDRGRASNYYYGSAKAGFTAYLSGLRNRLQFCGVHVLTVKPGFMDTAMTAELDLPPALTASPDEAARAIVKAAQKRRNVIYTKSIWRLVMLVITHIPEFIFKKLKL